MSRQRAEGLVRVARRAGELPECWALFQAGRIGEDAMVRIARRVPAERDMEVAALAPELLVSQLDRLLRSLPELPDPDARPVAEPERTLEMRTGRDGWLRGRFCLPPDEGAMVQTGLTASRDAEFRDRNGLDDDAEVHPDIPAPGDDASLPRVTWADGLVRMATAAIDALDGSLQRTGNPGDRHQIVVHHDVDPDGRLGPGQLEYGPVIPDWLARFLGCDAKVLVAVRSGGRLVGLHPTDRHPNRAMRRHLARRDQGCVHPLCHQRRWLHAHHIVHWQNGGLSVADNLVLLCPAHHRALHRAELTIEGDPEAGTVRFRDRFGRHIAPPNGGDPPGDGRPPDGSPPGGRPPDSRPPGGDATAVSYRPPSAEPVHWRDLSWN